MRNFSNSGEVYTLEILQSFPSLIYPVYNIKKKDERERESEINVRFLETIYAWRYIINESNLSRGWKFEIEGTTHFTFLRPRLFVARATISHSLPLPSLSLSLSLFFSFSKPRTCATVWTGWLNICYPAVPLSRISARVRKHRRRQPARVVARLRRMAPASRHFAGIFFFFLFFPASLFAPLRQAGRAGTQRCSRPWLVLLVEVLTRPEAAYLAPRIRSRRNFGLPASQRHEPIASTGCPERDGISGILILKRARNNSDVSSRFIDNTVVRKNADIYT